MQKKHSGMGPKCSLSPIYMTLVLTNRESLGEKGSSRKDSRHPNLAVESKRKDTMDSHQHISP